LSIQNKIQSGRRTRSTANRSLLNDRDNNAPEKFISSQTLMNVAARKRDMRKKGGKVQAGNLFMITKDQCVLT
jgi:hypothetical protein